ncbi:hypothetical protein HPB47_016444 [Ixodes persulcatus]|uniref:Uncharacterized protein n=1 Tax=Ixodes persulcatus TaxID=34615 RepID=A0AC60R1J6_IXOPE|nr:hypothetical protein HPB47_016444 [Ixodes persulcatus]
MPTMCIVRNCSTTYRSAPNVRFHNLPREQHRRALWLRAIDRDGPDDIGDRVGHLCSDHSLPGDYEMNIQVRQSLGLDTKHARLKSDAVPMQNLWFSAPPRKRRRSEDTSDWSDVVDVVVKASTSHRMVDGWAQTARNIVTASCQTAGGDVQTRWDEEGSEDEVEQCSEFFPSFNETFVGLDNTTEEVSPRDDRKFIVFESSLRKLFKVCRTCYAPCKSVSRVSGTMLGVQTLCAKDHCLLWRSQPVMNGKSAGNVLVSAGILFTGTSPTSVLRTLEHINIQVFTLQTFHNYQRGYLLPAINKKTLCLNQIWQEQQEEVFLQLEGQKVDLAGDGQCDSPGFSAKYMTYSLHAAQLNKILHLEQVQVGECAEEKSSTSMEKHAFLRRLEKVKDRKLNVVSLSTDRHVQAAKHMRTEEPTIQHYFDGWQISEGIKKKLAAQAKRAGCSVLEIWIQLASNHLF